MSTIKDILHGCKAGRPQTVGVMTIIPLTSRLQDERFDLISPREGDLAMTFPEIEGDADKAVSETDNLGVTTPAYGTLRFRNRSGKTVIVPAQSAYLTKGQQQDHTMTKGGLVGPGKSTSYDDAKCIQSTTPGSISESHKAAMVVLPAALREEAFTQANAGKSYDSFWPPLARFLSNMGCSRHDRYGGGQYAHLDHFIAHFDKELAEFVAEFEIVEGQVGAIILINGAVVGIERAPSRRYWASVWKPLIRECYGSLAIAAAKQVESKEAKLHSLRVPLDTRDVDSIGDLAKALRKATEKEDTLVKNVVADLLDEPFEVGESERVGTCEMQSVQHKQFAGQIVRDGDWIVYASLVVTKKWPRYAKRHQRGKKWKRADEFTL